MQRERYGLDWNIMAVGALKKAQVFKCSQKQACACTQGIIVKIIKSCAILSC